MATVPPTGTAEPPTRTLQHVPLGGGQTAGIAILPNDGTFIQSSNCPAIMYPNTNCVIQVVFTPPDTGNSSATLSVTDNDKSSPQTVSLS